MLHLIPAPLHRQLYRIADKVRRHWWRISKPTRSSAHVVAFDGEGRVLLVRHSYGPPVWALPGGGMARGEDPAEAAAREFREELSCGLADLVPILTREQSESGSRDTKNVFTGQLDGVPTVDGREVVEVRLFEPTALPANRARNLAEWVALALNVRSEQR